jgi:hypothetical protein
MPHGRDDEPDLWKRNAGPLADLEPLPRRRRGAVALLVVLGIFVCCAVFGALVQAGVFR